MNESIHVLNPLLACYHELLGSIMKVKRGIGGVNNAVSAKHVKNYLNEYAFRYNWRQDERPMFEGFLCQVVVSGLA